MSSTENPQPWWITTEELTHGGEKILGPFATRELALEVRRYVEAVKAPLTFWVDQEEAVDVPASSAPGGAGEPNNNRTET